MKEAERQIELAAAMPGVEEVAMFDRITELIITRLDTYDMLIFDTAPTGHTLRLLRMPELMESWICALSKRRRAMIELNNDMDSVRLKSAKKDAESDPILATLERRKDKLEQMRARLMQHNFTGFVLVLIPERLPIEETARAAETLRESNVNVCGMMVNRILPDDLSGEFYQARRQQEQVYRNEILRRFANYPLTWIPQFSTDVYGLKNLERVSEILSA